MNARLAGAITALFGIVLAVQTWHWSRLQLPIQAPLLVLLFVGVVAGALPSLQPWRTRLMFLGAWGSAFVLLWAAGQPSAGMALGRVWILTAAVVAVVLSLLMIGQRAHRGREWVLPATLALIFGLFIAYMCGPAGGPDRMMRLFHWLLGEPDENWRYVQGVTYAVRKMLHFTGYGMAAYCTAKAVWYLGVHRSKAPLVALGWLIPLALFDEFSQTMSTVRSGKLGDVMIDAAGMIAFLAFFLWETGMRERLGDRPSERDRAESAVP